MQRLDGVVMTTTASVGRRRFTSCGFETVDPRHRDVEKHGIHARVFDAAQRVLSGLQAKLLHVLQDGEFARVGGEKLIGTDVRLIAATNRDLENAMRTR